MSFQKVILFFISILFISSCYTTLVYENPEEKEYEKFQFHNAEKYSRANKFIYTHIKDGDKLVSIGTFNICDKDRMFLHFDSTLQKTHLLPIDRGQFRLTRIDEAERILVSKISVIEKYSKQALSYININGFLDGHQVLSEKPTKGGRLDLNPPLAMDSISIFYKNRTIPTQLKIDHAGLYEIDAFINNHRTTNKVNPSFHQGVNTEMNVQLKDGKIYKVSAPNYKGRVYHKK